MSNNEADMKEFLDLLKTPSTIANQVVECNKMEKTKKGILHQEFVGEFNDRKITVIIDQPFSEDKQPKGLLFKSCLLSIKLMPQTILEKYMGIKAALTQQVLDEVQNDTQDEEELIEEAEEVLEGVVGDDDDIEELDEVEEIDEEMMTESGEPIPTEPAPVAEPEKPKKSRAKKEISNQTLFNTPHL
jgi:hypothetical protein